MVSYQLTMVITPNYNEYNTNSQWLYHQFTMIHNDYTTNSQQLYTNSQWPTIAVPSTHNGYTSIHSKYTSTHSDYISTHSKLSQCLYPNSQWYWTVLVYAYRIWLYGWWLRLVVFFSWNFVFLYFVVNNPLCCLPWYQKYLIVVFFSPKYYFFSPKNS